MGNLLAALAPSTLLSDLQDATQSSVVWMVALPSIAFACVYFKLKAKHSSSPLPGLPCPPPEKSNWLIGHVEDRTIDIEDSLAALCRDHANPDGVTAMWYFATSTVTVLRYQDARAILQSTPARMNMPVIIRKHLEMLTGPRNILVLEGKEWKFHRSAIVRSLGPQTMNKARFVSASVAQELGQTLVTKCKASSNGTIQENLRPLMQMVALDVFGRSAIDFDFANCKRGEFHPTAQAFHYMNQEYDRRMSSPLSGFFYGTPTKRNREYRNYRKQIRDFLEGCVEDRLGQQDEAAQKQDLLYHLVKAKEELVQSGDSAAVVEETMTDILMTLLFAGHETTALTLVYAILEVARNPTVEAKALQEIQNVWPDKEQVPEPTELVYCTAIVTEASRLYPSVPGMVRTLTKPVDVGTGKNKYTLPVGTYTYIPFYLVHRDERNFARPTEYLPERWATQDAKTGAWSERTSSSESMLPSDDVPMGNRDAFLSFSTGGRSCPGQKFAMQEAVLVLANLLREVQFRWKPNYELHVKHAATGQRPGDEVPVLCSARK